VEHTTNNIGRATKGAALAMAAKANLYLQNWSGVIELINEIKGLGIYQLTEDYKDNFSIETQNSVESVWEIQHKNLELSVGNFLNQWWASRKIEGYGFAEARVEFADSFEPGDPRKSFTVASKDEDYFGTKYKNSFSTTAHSPRKFLQPDSTVSQKSDGDINYTAIRFAEVLLWEAEALVELNSISEAEVPLETVRARARAQAEDSEMTLPSIVAVDQQQMRDAIRQERKVELGFELHRFFDLIRWGIADEVLDGFENGKHELFPLPQNELDLNPQLTQNPGY
jgi:hypothetical protein